jgi:hypothetical protein
VQAALVGLVVEHVQVDVLEDDCAVQGVGGPAVVDAEVRGVAVEEEEGVLLADALDPQEDLAAFRGGLRANIGRFVLRFQHRMFN